MDDQGTNREGSEVVAPISNKQPHINSPLAKRALFVFLVGFAIIIAAAIFGPRPPWSILIVLPALLAMVGAAMPFALAIAFRDAVAFRQNRWRFSLRTLLIVMTLIAVVFGLVVWAIR
jgi:hypothetical protein